PSRIERDGSGQPDPRSKTLYGAPRLRHVYEFLAWQEGYSRLSAHILFRISHRRFAARPVINIMVGDLQRIRIYPGRGFQIEQDIPDDVWQAFEKLIELGYDKHLI